MLKVDINGINWTIVFVDKNDKNLYRRDGSLTVGMCDSHSRTIYLSNAISKKFLKKVIIHEMVHAFVFSYGLNLYKLDCEERMADILASFGAEILATSQEVYEVLEGD